MPSDTLSDSDLIPAQRQRLLLERIEQDGRVSSVQAALDFGVSEDTIRRDLRDLADAGMVERVHGGALRKSRVSHRFQTRLVHQEAEKTRLAAYALRFLRQDMLVLLDQSTSNLMLARQLPLDLSLTIATPSPDIALAALDRGIEALVLIGGRIDSQSRSASGAGALAQIENLRPDLCFLGACAIDVAGGISAVDHEDACLKRAMIAVSAKAVALVTADKLDTRAAYTVGPFHNLDHMVTLAEVPRPVIDRFDTSGVEIHLA